MSHQEENSTPKLAKPIFELDTSTWEAKAPIESTQDSNTYNCFFVGDAKSFALQGSIPDEVWRKKLDNGCEVTSEMRSKALQGFANIILGDVHIVGSKYSDKDKNQQPLLIRPHDSCVPFLDAANDWVPDEMVRRHVEWEVVWDRDDMDERDIRRNHISLWKKGKGKDGKTYEGKAFNARVFQDNVKIYMQDPTDVESFIEDARLRDVPKGAQCAFVIEIAGIRIKGSDGKYALQTPTVKEMWVFNRSRAESGTASFQSGSGPKIRKTGLKVPRKTDIKPNDDPTVGPSVAEPTQVVHTAVEDDMETEGLGTATMLDA